MDRTVPVTITALETLVTDAFKTSNVSLAAAKSVARALVLAEIDGQKGHGLIRVESYAAQARAGKVKGHAVANAQVRRPASLWVDAGNGFAYPALDLAIERLPDMARACGIAAAAITHSHHFGVAGHAVERLANKGFVALIVGNTPKAMAAAGGTRQIFGTNPLAFAAPRADAHPIVIDMALTEVARAKVLAAAAGGTSIPIGWAIDKTGKPTTDPKAALEGSLLPIGGAKGAGLALMVEVLAAALTGAHFGFEATSFQDDKGAAPDTGQFLLAIDPEAFGGSQLFGARMAALAREIESDAGTRLPGQHRHALRANAQINGIVVDPPRLAAIRAIAER